MKTCYVYCKQPWWRSFMMNFDASFFFSCMKRKLFLFSIFKIDLIKMSILETNVGNRLSVDIIFPPIIREIVISINWGEAIHFGAIYFLCLYKNRFNDRRFLLLIPRVFMPRNDRVIRLERTKFSYKKLSSSFCFDFFFCNFILTENWRSYVGWKVHKRGYYASLQCITELILYLESITLRI